MDRVELKVFIGDQVFGLAFEIPSVITFTEVEKNMHWLKRAGEFTIKEEIFTPKDTK